MAMKYCMICGRWNNDGDKSCTGCGASLIQDDAPVRELSTTHAEASGAMPSARPDAVARKQSAAQPDTPVPEPAESRADVSARKPSVQSANAQVPKPTTQPVARVCHACGASNDPSSRFCTSCGASLEDDLSAHGAAVNNPSVRVCKACGAANDLSSRFCTTCGNPLATDSGIATQTVSTDNGQKAAVPTLPTPTTSLPAVPSSTSDAATVPIAPVPSSETPLSSPVPVSTPGPTPESPTRSVRPTVSQIPSVLSSSNAGNNALYGTAGGNKDDRGRRIVVIVIAAVVVIALVISGVLVWRSSNSKASQAKAQSQASSAIANNSKKKSTAKKPKKSATAKPKKSASDTASQVLDKQVMDAIVNTYNTGSGHAAVSVMSGNVDSYASSTASNSMNAAGLYLPPWLAYYDLVGGSPAGGYGPALSAMDNGTANELIDSDGGMVALNSWLDSHGYSETRFGHLYGDVSASENGYQNTTSSKDAANLLTQLIAKGEDDLLNYDIASDGVSVPDGATVHAHRGMGVGNAYDYYMVVSDGSKKIVVVVLTEGQTKEQAASLTSVVLQQVWQKMFISGK